VVTVEELKVMAKVQGQKVQNFQISVNINVISDTGIRWVMILFNRNNTLYNRYGKYYADTSIISYMCTIDK